MPISYESTVFKHFLAALSERLEDFPAEPQIGDVLLSHVSFSFTTHLYLSRSLFIYRCLHQSIYFFFNR